MRWQPRVTVAAIAEKDGKFLVVEELIKNELCLNQPAGHWEQGETLIEAVKREALEETAWQFHPEFLLGIYQWQHPEEKDLTYLRFAFAGKVSAFNASLKLDEGITQAIWLSREELCTSSAKHRSPLVLRCVDDYISGKRFDLSILTAY